ncbi:uncharacterized protein K452DRAFT_33789 [Aplosporella prunicola CBS 121167]|uniref:dihydroneopterin aldolase n=1 Tax=Aplosporella prunicola CBS 121167 TaxID=1176127 RepID=A0A6A6BEX6_9PEZI|nr:uncharacterized protein K452DRAFT_33789 [Aplosporella prunicola CBS 121167]KAF2141794.1 hypothetical protein K452DRAFT_33789 [Aplosporella prunicola CBS 121167]
MPSQQQQVIPHPSQEGSSNNNNNNNTIITRAAALARWPHSADQISVTGLKTTAPAGRDLWGRKKPQPLEVSVTVAVARPFDTAAQADAVDASTVHYGLLSKSVLGNIAAAAQAQTQAQAQGQERETWLSTIAVAHAASKAILANAPLANLAAAEVKVRYPKASTQGEGAGAVFTLFYNREEQEQEQGRLAALSQVLYLENVRIPTLIGVNPNERLKKQLVVASLWIDKLAAGAADCYVEVEDLLVSTIESTTFETLEALAETVSRRLFADFISRESPGSGLFLRLEKPSAVPFADAPAIQVYRTQ